MLTDEKSFYYSRAIAMLGIYDRSAAECENLISRYYDRDKAYNMFLRLFKNAKSDRKHRSTVFVYESPGMKGVYTVSFPKNTLICKIPEYYGVEHLLTNTAMEALCRLGVSHEYSCSPFRDGRINAIYIPSASLAVIADKNQDITDDVKIINPKRFVSHHASSCKKDLREISKNASFFMEKALNCFEKMSDIHFGVEDIYSSALDISSKERFSEELIKSILKQ